MTVHEGSSVDISSVHVGKFVKQVKGVGTI